MARFASYDGTQIGYRTLGDGPALVCLPGGPGRTCEHFGDLGGLSRSRQLIMPDTRGTGESAHASDPLSYRCDRLAGDVEALRAHIGLDRMDLLGHSAAGDLATLYAAAFAQRVTHLILLTPGLDAVGVEETRRAMARGARAQIRRSRGIQRHWLRWKRQRPGASRWRTGAHTCRSSGRWDITSMPG